LFAAPLASACVSQPAAPPPDDQVSQQVLDQLAAELVETPPDQVIARIEHFRPLCDKDGYPLVGNPIKTPPDQLYNFKPSTFCNEVRNRQ
jgi:hypothetical protein